MSIELQKIEHLIDRQFAAEEAMRAECAKGGFTLEKPYVKLNPYLIAPLTALVHFRTPEPTEAKVTVNGKEAAGDMGGSFPKATEHWLPVLGLYPGYENTVEITLGDQGIPGACARILTGDMNAHNTFDAPDAVKDEAFTDFHVKDGVLTAKLPPVSVTHFILR